jgi:agmatinase
MGKTEGHEAIRNTINEESDQLRKWVFEQCTALLDQGKLTGLIGGDHSTPLGFMQALSIRHASFGILQIDAHADLRKAYEGFTYSHASIMHNALDIPQVSSLVQLGLRDVCQEEMDRIISDDRIHAFFYQDIQAARYEGQSWKQACEGIISKLPEEVYISFDIDGLDPKLCPNTGTPVAGGFEMSEIIFLLQELVRSGRRIIGFDLVEVAPGADEWDANVGVRLLYKLCNLMVKSNGR